MKQNKIDREYEQFAAMVKELYQNYSTDPHIIPTIP
jgi:hypothetical protein